MQSEVPGKVDIYRPLAINKTIVKKTITISRWKFNGTKIYLDSSEMKSIFFYFMHFVFFDVNGKRWISSSLKCKPVATSNLFKKKKIQKLLHTLYLC